jgi:hypothetical protein
MKTVSYFMTYADMHGHGGDALLARSRNPGRGAYTRLSGLLATNLYSLYGYMQRNAANPFAWDFLEASEPSALLGRKG